MPVVIQDIIKCTTFPWIDVTLITTSINFLVISCINVNAGTIYIYTNINNVFTLLQTISNPNTVDTPRNSFGYSIAISENILLVGDISDPSIQSNGSVTFYSYNGVNWDYINNYGSDTSITFGDLLATSGSICVMGDSTSYNGELFISSYVNGDLIDYHIINNIQNCTKIQSIAMTNTNYLIINVLQNDGSGIIYLYKNDGSNHFIKSTIQISIPQFSCLQTKIAISGYNIAISDYSVGNIYLIKYDGTNITNLPTINKVGILMSMIGNHLIICDQNNIYISIYDGTNWGNMNKIIIPNIDLIVISNLVIFGNNIVISATNTSSQLIVYIYNYITNNISFPIITGNTCAILNDSIITSTNGQRYIYTKINSLWGAPLSL